MKHTFHGSFQEKIDEDLRVVIMTHRSKSGNRLKQKW